VWDLYELFHFIRKCLIISYLRYKLVPRGGSNPPWRFIYLHLVAVNVIYQGLAAFWNFYKMQIGALKCRESGK